MCGICGVVQVSGAPREVLPSHVLDVMTDAMTHRGPNDRGTYSAPGIALGVRRLSIVDVAGGHQPVENEDGSVVAIQNGELYNHEEIRRALRADGHRLETRCDTEILPHLYERDGDLYPAALVGKFGIAVWDALRRRAVLARDRLGVKPLYWAQVSGLVVFASELKSMLASGLVDLELDYEALDLYFTFGYIPGPRTPLVGVNKLSPGSTLGIEADRVVEQVYWEYPRPMPNEHMSSLDDCADELLQLLRIAVRDRLMSDVPLGAMLSGGLDSSLIVALMSEGATLPVQTFSVGFRGDSSSELADARRIASHFGCDHHELELVAERDTIALDDLVWHLDEPIADLSALGFDLLSKYAAEHVTVALAGQGADELFGGYTKHRVAAAVSEMRFVPGGVRSIAGRLPLPDGRYARLRDAIAARDPSSRLLAMSGRLSTARRSDLYRGALADVPNGTAFRAVEHARSGVVGDPLAVTLYLDAKLGLVDHMLLYFDRTSMAHSLEVRVPFVDHRLVEWAATVPPAMKVHRSVTKRVLKQAGVRVLPTESVEKPKVGFFRSALDGWLEQQLRSNVQERLLSSDSALGDLVDRRALEGLINAFLARPGEETGRLVYASLVLESWLTTFRSRSRDVARASS